jgi:hypothetical protein
MKGLNTILYQSTLSATVGPMANSRFVALVLCRAEPWIIYLILTTVIDRQLPGTSNGNGSLPRYIEGKTDRPYIMHAVSSGFVSYARVSHSLNAINKNETLRPQLCTTLTNPILD